MTSLHITSAVAYSTIRRVFRDPYVEVTTTTINRLARALDVAPTVLLAAKVDLKVVSELLRLAQLQSRLVSMRMCCQEMVKKMDELYERSRSVL